MRKHLPLLILAFVVVFVISAYIAFLTTNKKQAPITVRDIKVPQTQSAGVHRSTTQLNVSADQKVSATTIEETNVPSIDPKAGEIIVYGEVKAVDVEKRVLTVDQQMDDNSVKISPNIPVNKDAIIRSKQEVVSLAQIKPGDSVGVIVAKDRQARAVLVNY
ncbi:MAG: hypothetical protein RO469_14525 [Thermincola sp.]|nr:hypothetical protein [Thermincola sp.]MDT3704542.1 hypothetical protein [Thermincola sp.]